MLHTLSPFLIEFPAGFPIPGIRWYGLAYAFGFVAGWLLVRRVAAAGKTPLSVADAADFAVATAIGVMAGGRVGYALFYDPAMLWTFTRSVPFWELLAIQRGGMASHGGMIGVLLAVGVYGWRRGVPVLHTWDLTAFGAPMGILFGRLANYVNGELYGRPVRDPSFPLAVRFPQELSPHTPLADGSTLAEHLSTYPGAASLVDAVRAADPLVMQAVLEHAELRHPVQLYAAAGEGLLVFLIVAWVFRKPVRPGLAAAAFGVSYTVIRMIDELFREPDAGVQTYFHLTRGQLLSAFLGVAALALGAVVLWRKKPRLGGWWAGAAA
ncbi:prolipoprotein diacylglyceryl transferase [Phycisphaera mikurensis]|uniref:Phosphatidylglycerol--prolipoprotein diacylglyceryl transferase n=1 Tax=Phycisphaera mikurensis (strain NBRC 102666 / KCTC 22515 / FYK2301M01) TaxID=1142394 RepID=I0IB90_PHYMF|nr:prolipoprotein diacylglyceryl transferase [Phycisphaera mikurensis]MBB6443026.1 phosphatidylglycerol:prolipoprotein diacylglycerol transferase [Phycisphaera mikurensis]BAM02528.1 prolipoprotein diacylglyceryl transferase [Phycisphaera mikurensis NBRC 102666]